MTTVITGTCIDMCPLKERLMREREGLLHKFERSDDLAEAGRGVATRSSLAASRNRVKKMIFKGDVSKVVKTFTRSAAGLDKTSPADLRPSEVLERTVVYLYGEILTRRDEQFTTIYDFIFDRLRAIRQDLVIQRITDSSAIRILESMVRFHVYSAYRCRHEPPTTFDPNINRKHLMDNLKRLLSLYELNSYWRPSRAEFESLYVILCPESGEVLRRALAMRGEDELKDDKNYQRATQMSLSYQCNNFVKYFKLLKLLPPLMCAATFQHTRKLRLKSFKVISKGFGSSTCKYPLLNLQSLLLYPTLEQVEADLRLLNVHVVQDSMKKIVAVFGKSSVFDQNNLVDSISSDLEPLCGSDCIMHPAQIDAAAKLICPQVTIISNTVTSRSRSEPDPPSSLKEGSKVTRDWFSNSSDEEK